MPNKELENLLRHVLNRLNPVERRSIAIEAITVNFIGRLTLGQNSPEQQLFGMKKEILSDIAKAESGQPTDIEYDEHIAELHMIVANFFGDVEKYVANARKKPPAL